MSTLGESAGRERNYGIDLLKIIAMFMVVVLHVLGSGGVLRSTEHGTAAYTVAWLMELGAYCAVDCFAIATGFLMVGRKVRYRRLVSLWTVVFFYVAAISLVDMLVLHNPISNEEITHFLPASSGAYWYFTAYFAMFLFLPFINKMIEALNKKEMYSLLLTGFLLFSVSNVIVPFPTNSFYVGTGYNALWLIYCYLIGAAIQKHGLFAKIPCPLALGGYVASVVLTYLSKEVIYFLQLSESALLAKLATAYGEGRFVKYPSPTVLASAVFLVIFCLRLPIAKWAGRIFAYLSPLVFQVYIIHLHPAVWEKIGSKKYVAFAEAPVWKIPLLVFGAAGAIFFCCLAVDWVRDKLFRLLHINRLIDIVSDKLPSLRRKRGGG